MCVVLANTAVGGLALGYFLYSFAFSAAVILLLLFVLARHEAEFNGRVLLITPVVLCVVELGGSVFWTLVWHGTPDRFLTLGSVMAVSAVVGCVLIYKIHIVGAVKSVLIMMGYTVSKSLFVIAMTYTYLYPVGVYVPTPFSAWYLHEAWRGREVAEVRAEFPGEFLPVRFDRDRIERHSHGRYTAEKFFEVDLRTFRVRVVRLVEIRNPIDPSIDLSGSVYWLFSDENTEKAKRFRESSPFIADVTVSGRDAARLKTDFVYGGGKKAADAVLVSEGKVGWLVIIDGDREAVQSRAKRIFDSLEIVRTDKKVVRNVDAPEGEEREKTTDSGEDKVKDEGGKMDVDSADPGGIFPIERTITNKEGQKIDVTIVGRSETRLYFEMADGRLFKYLIRDLSVEDQDYVKELPVTQN